MSGVPRSDVEGRGDVTKEGDRSLNARQVVRHLLRREVKLIAVNVPLVEQGDDAEGVHQLRVSARRLRSEIRAMSDVLPKRPWRGLADDLDWAGLTLGKLRDLDVMAALFDAHVGTGDSLRGALTSQLDRRRKKNRRAVSELVRSARYVRAVETLQRLSKHPGLGDLGDEKASEVFLPSLWAASCNYLDFVGDPFERRSDVELHRVRIASKKCRYHFEIAGLFLGEPARAVAEALEDIQEILGGVQDRVVAVAFLDTVGVREEVDLALRRELRGEIAALRPRWTSQFEAARRAMIEVFDQDLPRNRP